MELTKMGPVEIWFRIAPVRVTGLSGYILKGDSLGVTEASGRDMEVHKVSLTRVRFQGRNNEFASQVDNARWVTGSRGLAVLNMGNPHEVVNLTLR